MSLLYSILPALFNGFPDFTAFFIAMARGNGGKLAGLTEKDCFLYFFLVKSVICSP